MKIPFYWVDAFTARAFGGNPAGVCPLDAWPEDALLQKLAWQHGLAETAFFVRTGDARFHLRWFTPELEIDLCGHATLATAHALFHERHLPGAHVTFDTRSGPLVVTRVAGGRLELDFPSRPPVAVAPADVPPALLAGLGGAAPAWVGRARDYLCVYPHARDVLAIRSVAAELNTLDVIGIIVTAPGEDCDFVSRFFAPNCGVPEDPVTGSAHCTLVPYWSARLGKNALHARQVSARGGELWCTQAGERVRLAGHAVTYLRGEITLP